MKDIECLISELKGKKRIAIIGRCGSGKSTLAKKLGAVLELPVYHLDTFFWKPGWVEDKTGLREKHDEAILDDEWVIDGN